MESQKYTLTITCYSDTLVAELNDGDGVPILKTTYAIVDEVDTKKLVEEIRLELEKLLQDLSINYSFSDPDAISGIWGD
jgi:hypothetical protein